MGKPYSPAGSKARTVLVNSKLTRQLSDIRMFLLENAVMPTV